MWNDAELGLLSVNGAKCFFEMNSTKYKCVSLKLGLLGAFIPSTCAKAVKMTNLGAMNPCSDQEAQEVKRTDCFRAMACVLERRMVLPVFRSHLYV
ncbi:hypothetical protein Y1Q_0010501 [Alligator mississippiensis]|uniref:Uncharacterized protein n=1 Tax=Alligator mississippiensis TaxID=8496 RepID=A0A151ND68_ALLMI|nr:hypothetical protein Y1Q_0010501 [Alligator mississippiensis]